MSSFLVYDTGEIDQVFGLICNFLWEQQLYYREFSFYFSFDFCFRAVRLSDKRDYSVSYVGVALVFPSPVLLSL